MPSEHEYRWRAGVKELWWRRGGYTAERLAYYDQMATDCLAILQPTGEVLDIGAGTGGMAARIACTRYVGVDPGAPDGHPVRRAVAEALPFEAASFDTVLLYSVLQHVLDPPRALAEAHRVLRPGGRLCVQASVRDANRLFLWQWAPDQLAALVCAAGFAIDAERLVTPRILCLRARKEE